MDPKRLKIATLQGYLHAQPYQFNDVRPIHVPTLGGKMRFLGPNLASPEYVQQVAAMRACVTETITRLHG
ncbi:MAG: hypothetical protein ACRD3I_13720, partial [Terriglobales bacterium]